MHKKHWLPTCASLALVLLFWTNGTARADIIWGYNWEPSTAKVYANAGGSGFLKLTDEPANSATGSSNTVVTNIQAISTSPYNTPDVFNKATVSFTLQLKDLASKATGTFKVYGYFSGIISGHFSNVQFTPTMTASQTLTLGGNKYTVQLGSYTPPGPPGVVNSGSLNAFVTVAAGNGGGGHTSGVPEPTALTLACLALPFAGMCGWRRKWVMG